MDEGERKEEPSLPPDYVSLAQLQERWLQKQEEKKLKQKQEEEEKREREARAAQNEKNQNQNQNQRGMRNDGRARMVGGFVREKAVIQDKGKGKEIITGGPGIGGENDKKREIDGQGKKGNFKRAAAVEPKEKTGVDAEELSGGDTVRAGFSSGGVGGVGGGLNLVEEKGNAFGKVLLRNGVKEEIADVKKTDIGGGLKGNGRNRGLGSVDELKQGEMTLNLEKKMEGEKGYGKKRKGKEKRKGKGKGGGGRNDVEEKGNVSVEEVYIRNGVKEDIADVKRPDLRGGLRGNSRNQGSGGVNELKQSEMAVNLEKKMEGEKGYGKEWRGAGRNGVYPKRLNMLQKNKPVVLESNKVDPALENQAGDNVSEVCRDTSRLSVGDTNGIRGRSSSRNNKAEEIRVEGEGSSGDKVVLEIEKMEGEKWYGGRQRWVAREKRGGGNGDYPKRFNRALEHRPVVLEGNKVNPELEKKVEDEVSEVSSEISSLSVGDTNGIWGQNSSGNYKAEEDRVEGEGSNGDKVVLEIEKKMEGENGYGGRGRGRGGLRNGNYQKSFNKLQEHRPVVLEGSKMDSELGKKAGDEVSEVSFEISSLSVGNRNGIGGRSSNRSNKAEDDRVEGEGSNGDKIVLEIEKKIDDEKGFGGRGRGRWRGGGGGRGRGRGRGRNGVFSERSNRFQEHRPVVLDGNKVDPELEKNAGDEVSEASSEISSLSAGDSNGIQGQSSNGSNTAEEDRVEAERSNGDKVAQEIEKKVDREVLAGESARKGENGGAGKGNQIYGNQRGDIGQGRRDTRLGISDSHWRGNFGRGRGHTRPGISDSHWRGDFGPGSRHTRPQISEWETKHRVTGMVWVKKEEKLGA